MMLLSLDPYSELRQDPGSGRQGAPFLAGAMISQAAGRCQAPQTSCEVERPRRVHWFCREDNRREGLEGATPSMITVILSWGVSARSSDASSHGIEEGIVHVDREQAHHHERSAG